MGTKRGGEDLFLKLYLSYFKTLKKVPFATQLEGGKAFVAIPLKIRTFFVASPGQGYEFCLFLNNSHFLFKYNRYV